MTPASEATQRWLIRHGPDWARTYRVWCSMIGRCCNPKHRRFADYGGRGITVDPAWRKFEAFLADMGESPFGLTLERKENNMGYSKSNCYWATPKQQARNRRSNRYVLCQGKQMTLADAADKLGVSWQWLSNRLRYEPDTDAAFL